MHRALEVSGGAPDSLDDAALADLAREQSERALDDATARALAGEVREMLDRFTRSPVAAALASADIERWFELPFAWDWDGVPVHGSIDLVYRDASGWHVIDFKSDRLNGTSAQAGGKPLRRADRPLPARHRSRGRRSRRAPPCSSCAAASWRDRSRRRSRRRSPRRASG